MTLGLDDQEVLDSLIKVSQEFLTVVSDLRTSDVEYSPAATEWSAKEVLCHLRDADKIYVQRIQKMLQEDEPVLRAFTPESLAKENNYQEQNWQNVFREFMAARQELIGTFQQLRPSQWYRAGIHQELGRINMYDIAQTITDHTRLHLEQIQKLEKQIS